MSHRLFVGIRPPSDVRNALIDTMEGLEGARWQDDDQLHLTLRYCGECDAGLADDLSAALSRISFAPFELALAGAGHFETRGKPHTLWAGVAPSPQLIDLQKRVERACQNAGLAPESRKFAPHVTLARMNASTEPPGRWLSAHGDLRTAVFTVSEFILYESHLGESGSIYEPIVRYALR